MDRVLVAEGSLILAHAIQRRLEREGYEVTLITDGDKALEAFLDRPFPLVLADQQLAGLNGIDLLKRIHSTHPDTKVVFMTSAGNEEIAAEAINNGASSYVIKGSQRDVLPFIVLCLENARKEIRLLRENRALLSRLREQNDVLARTVRERTEELRKAYERLKGLDRAKTDFITLISHELRTPITSVVGFSEVVREGLYRDEEELREILSHIEEQGTRLAQFVDDAVELLHWISGDTRLTIRMVPVEDVIDRAISFYVGAISERGIRIVREGGKDLQVLGDADCLEGIFGRVLDNAIKFSRPSGRVSIQASSDAGGVRIEVRDEGIGIPPERKSRLFQPLEIGRDLRHHSNGRGLGLSIAKQAVEAHGGTISLDSEGEGKGCVVRVWLPSEAKAVLAAQPSPFG